MEELEVLLKKFDTGAQIECYERIDSTNIRAKAWAKEGACGGSLVIAKEQTLGKGRLGKVWDSPKGTGIWMSLILRPSVKPAVASLMTLVAGLSMCEAIQKVANLPAKIKWPNDIVVNGKKVCGILTEMQAKEQHVNYVIIGIGVNVNMEEFPQELPYATSLKIEGGRVYSKKEILKKFLEIFYGYYEHYKVQGFYGLKESYMKQCVTLYEKVRIVSANESYVGYVKDMNEEGSLIVEDEQGLEHVVFTGEVSVRGLYGYV